MSQSFFTDRAAIAKTIKRELLADDRPKHTSLECFACGREFLKRDGRFCSPRCRDAFDAGALPFDPTYTNKSNRRWYSLPMGRHGFQIPCRGCGQTFDSIGFRCCSAECERKFRRKEQLEAELK